MMGGWKVEEGEEVDGKKLSGDAVTRTRLGRPKAELGLFVFTVCLDWEDISNGLTFIPFLHAVLHNARGAGNFNDDV